MQENQEYMQLLAFVGDRFFAMQLLEEEIDQATDRLRAMKAEKEILDRAKSRPEHSPSIPEPLLEVPNPIDVQAQ